MDATPNRQRFAKNCIQEPAGAAGIVCQLPSSRHLANDLLLADAHGIEAAACAESVGKGLFVEQAGGLKTPQEQKRVR